MKNLFLIAALALTFTHTASAESNLSYAMDLYNAEVAKCKLKGEHAEEMAALNHKTEPEQKSAADETVNSCIKELNTRIWSDDFDSWKVQTH